MSLPRFLRACVLLLGVVLCLAAEPKSAQIESLLKRYHEYGLFNGAALVAENGNVVHKAGYGMADMEWKIPNTTDTRFRLGSITKQFTSAIILQLVNEGKLKLEDPLSQYLPDYPAKVADKVTIRHLLNHTSGIPSYTRLPDFRDKYSRDPFTVFEFIKTFSSLDLEFEPGTKYNYNNSGYFLLGAIIEKVTGDSYEAALRKRIAEPLGLTGTGYDWHAPILEKRARAYESTIDGYQNAPYLDMSIPYAAGSMYSTVEDLYKWDQALHGNAVLPETLRALAFKPGLGDYGFGWVIREVDRPGGEGKVKIVEHGGGINGFNTIISRVPAERHLIVLLNNTGGAPLEAMVAGIRNILYGKAAEMPKRPAGPLLWETYKRKGIDAALAQFAQWKANEGSGVDVGIRGLGQFGQHLIREKKPADAVRVMTVATSEFPKEWQAHLVLGDAQMAVKDREAARKSYAHALELCPEGATTVVVNKIKELVP